MDSVCHSQVVFLRVQGLETPWCAKSDHLDSIGASSVRRVFWAEMARLRLPSARLVFDLPQHDALAGKDAMRPYLSLALSPPTPGCESHVPPLQSTQPFADPHLHNHSNDPVCCPECLEPMTLKHFYYNHALKHIHWILVSNAFCFGRRQWNYGEKHLSVNVNHIVSGLKLFVTNEKDFSAIVEEKEEDIAEAIEVEMCECQHFQSNPRDMAGRRKLNSVGFYDSMFEKPEMWEDGIEFQCGLGKDVWGIVERYRLPSGVVEY
ncbi:uncharacterized protein TNCV_2789931 [Trichonephila clavipes]|nr:uncharacterized protein TNCV_2789931 [Trichonephila clavipes]